MIVVLLAALITIALTLRTQTGRCRIRGHRWVYCQDFPYLLVVFAVTILIVALAKERAGYWNDQPQPPMPEHLQIDPPPPMIMLTKHGDTWR